MKNKHRHLIQAFFTAVQNPHVGNFLKGRIHTGPSKGICVPGLNCYSCPAAAGACPIGSLQSALVGPDRSIPYYVIGLILLFGTLLGRLVCGFLCPFGLIQDLLHKIPVKKLHLPKKIDRSLRLLKWPMLLLVILGPVILTGAFGVGTPWFCKLICPSGTVLGGLPLFAGSSMIRSAVGGLFVWKVSVALSILVLSVLLFRPFCRYLCPLGLLYGLLNRVSLYKMHIDPVACIRCGRCETACPMEVDVLKNPNSIECIRCGLCKSACPTGAIGSGFLKELARKENTLR